MSDQGAVVQMEELRKINLNQSLHIRIALYLGQYFSAMVR